VVIGLAFAGLFGGALSVSAACTNPSPLPSGYAAPCPVWSVSPASVSQSGTLALSATPQAGTDYIYTTAYYAKGTQWLPLTLTGNNAAPSYENKMFVAAGPVSRILSAGLLRQDGHSSGPRITARLKRPTRRLWRTEPARA